MTAPDIMVDLAICHIDGPREADAIPVHLKHHLSLRGGG